MAAAAPPPPPLPPQDTFNEAEFLRRTFDRSLAEMERSREFFERLLRHATWYIGIVTTVGFSLIAFLGFRSYSDVESRLNNEMQKVAADITDQGKKTIAQTDEEIRKNAAAAFEQANLKAYIREVAKGKTEQVLAGQINRSVNEKWPIGSRRNSPKLERPYWKKQGKQ